jgi:hypothetical protein
MRELFEGEARVFPRPSLGEKQGKPAGPGLVGVPFSCFFFWARKRRKSEWQNGHHYLPRNYRMNLFLWCGASFFDSGQGKEGAAPV